MLVHTSESMTLYACFIDIHCFKFKTCYSVGHLALIPLQHQQTKGVTF